MSGAAKNHDAELKHIEEVSRNARTTWFGMLGVLVFGAIAVLGVEDRDFFTYGVETALPLVGVSVPTDRFFIAAPILILAIYIYLHLYLLKLWRGLAALPATVTVAGERKPLDDAVYPWLLSDAAIHLKPGARKRTLGWLTRLVSLALGWLAGPVVLGLFWVRSWPNHDPVLTLYLAGLTLAAVCIGTFTYFRARRDLRGGPRTWRVVFGWLSAGLNIVINTVGLLFLSLIMTDGTIPGLIETGPVWSAKLYQAEIVARPEDWLPRGEAEEVFLAEYGDVSRSTLDALLAAERDGGDPPEGESLDWLDAARGAFTEQRRNLLLSFDKLDLSDTIFHHTDLRRANLRDAFLPGIRLVGASLGGADMSGAQMEGVVFSEKVNGEWITADLAGAPCDKKRWDRIQPAPPKIPPARAALGCTRLANAHLEGADLSEANLSGADLKEANLSDADLGSANLSGADLVSANLSGADLGSANLSGADLGGLFLCATPTGVKLVGLLQQPADLSGANLREADLSGAGLCRANLSDADLGNSNLSDAILIEANFSSANLSGANLSDADLGSANLSSANLSLANLSGADLGGADLSGAVLYRANLSGADLSGANLSGADLSGANLSDADLRGTNLSGMDLSGTNLSGAKLGRADLSSANLSLANLSGADLRGAILSGANLSLTNLSGANLFRADLSGTDLKGANLSGADLGRATLSGADLHGTNLGGVDLGDISGADGLQLEGAIGDDKTRLPPRWPTPHVIATCYDTLAERNIFFLAQSWQMDAATFRARYVCPEGTPPGRIEGALRPGR